MDFTILNEKGNTEIFEKIFTVIQILQFLHHHLLAH